MKARSRPNGDPLDEESREGVASGILPRGGDARASNRPRKERAVSAVLPAMHEGVDLINLRVPSELSYRDLVTRAVTKCCKVAIGKRKRQRKGAAIPTDFTHEFVSAVGEAFNNVVLHAYEDGDEDAMVTLVLRYDPDFVEVELRDRGNGFDPDGVPEPELADLPEGGMGLFIMRAFVDVISYRAGEPNVLILRKNF